MIGKAKHDPVAPMQYPGMRELCAAALKPRSHSRWYCAHVSP
jgi:hypothetical protein